MKANFFKLVVLFFTFIFLGMGVNGAEESVRSVYSFKVETIDGEPTTLETYRGKLLLIVNTASLCGYTKQYKTLEELYQIYDSVGKPLLL